MKAYYHNKIRIIINIINCDNYSVRTIFNCNFIVFDIDKHEGFGGLQNHHIEVTEIIVWKGLIIIALLLIIA